MSVAMTAMMPPASVYMPRSNCSMIVAGRKALISSNSPTLHPLSQRYIPIQRPPMTFMGPPSQFQNDFSHSTVFSGSRSLR